MKTHIAFFIFTLLFVLSACRGEKKKVEKREWSDNHSVDYNQEINEREQIQINLFLAHYTNLKMTLTESGLRYMIYKQGPAGELAKSGQSGIIRVKVETLDGIVRYETEADKTESFAIDKSEKESGIHEALKYMKVGDRAKLILPSYLGHGLLGDRQTIPPQAILLIDIELISLK
jgi:FKBP-type peptidyl-prolyl cis-trans isomerase